MPDFGELADQDVTLYRHVLLAPESPVAQVAEALGTTNDEIDKAVSRLSSLGLLRVDESDRLTHIYLNSSLRRRSSDIFVTPKLTAKLAFSLHFISFFVKNEVTW